jgi:hypothetical protein
MQKHDIAYDLKKQLDEYSDEYSDASADEDEHTYIPSSRTRMVTHPFTFSNTRSQPYRDQSNRKDAKIVKRDPILLKSFTVIQAPDSCIVHNRKYLSQFHGLLNLLRCTYEFPNRVYHNLLEACCSCEGRKGTCCLCANTENI